MLRKAISERLNEADALRNVYLTLYSKRKRPYVFVDSEAKRERVRRILNGNSR